MPLRLALTLFAVPWAAVAADAAEPDSPPAPPAAASPGEPIDYAPLAFFPDRWAAQQRETALVPWEGRRIVFLTTTADLDPQVMGVVLDRLDRGWAHYASLVGQAPQRLKELNGKPTIAAVPDASLTCGVGCGYVGATGIEAAKFYRADYEIVSQDPRAFPHYFFYEMGRNYYVFGDRHSEFTTGFAVFMRYVCMDAVQCRDPDPRTRRQIEAAEALYAASDLGFLKAFTTGAGLGEKAPRLKGVAGPSDQPVIYASAMLKLHRPRRGRLGEAVLRPPVKVSGDSRRR